MAENGATRRHVPVLGSERIEAFHAQGLLVVKGVFDRALLARLVETTAEVWEQARGLREGTAQFDIDPGHSHETPRHARVEAGVVELPPDYSGGYSSIYAHQGGEEKHRR